MKLQKTIMTNMQNDKKKDENDFIYDFVKCFEEDTLKALQIIDTNIINNIFNNYGEKDLTFYEDTNSEDVYESMCLPNSISKNKSLKNALSYVIDKRKDIFEDSFYNKAVEFYGVIESVNKSDETFTAIFDNYLNSKQSTNIILNIDDVQFESDKNLIRKGAKIILLLGQETKLLLSNEEIKKGPRTNVSKIYFRRQKGLTKKEMKEVEDEANRWTKFFNTERLEEDY